jgi:polar amino acid transport system permease protein
MSSDTLAKTSAAPDIPEWADSPRIVPQRRPGPRTAAVAVLVRGGILSVDRGRTEAAQALEKYYARGSERIR